MSFSCLLGSWGELGATLFSKCIPDLFLEAILAVFFVDSLNCDKIWEAVWGHFGMVISFVRALYSNRIVDHKWVVWRAGPAAGGRPHLASLRL